MGTSAEFGRKIAAALGEFARARQGGVAIMFALALPVLTMAGVVALDLQRA